MDSTQKMLLQRQRERVGRFARALGFDTPEARNELPPSDVPVMDDPPQLPVPPMCDQCGAGQRNYRTHDYPRWQFYECGRRFAVDLQEWGWGEQRDCLRRQNEALRGALRETIRVCAEATIHKDGKVWSLVGPDGTGWYPCWHCGPAQEALPKTKEAT